MGELTHLEFSRCGATTEAEDETGSTGWARSSATTSLPQRSQSGAVRQEVRGGNFRVPASRLLDGAPLSVLEVDVYQAKALAVTLQPFEIVEQAPTVIRPDRITVSYRPRKRAEMGVQEVDPLDVANPAVRVRQRVVRRAVLGHVQWAPAAGLAVHGGDDLVEALRIDLPAKIGALPGSGCTPHRAHVEPGDTVRERFVMHGE